MARPALLLLAVAFAPRALAAPARLAHALAPAQPDDSECGADTVAYLFLVNDSLPLAEVWREYFNGCGPGKAVVHIHSQAALPRVPEAWAELDVPVHLVDKPVEGDLRFGWSFVEAPSPPLHGPSPGSPLPDLVSPARRQ